MIVVTTEHIAGYKQTASLGMVRGSSMRARHVGRDIMAALRMFVGGEVREYSKLLGESREQAADRMIEEAQAMGADAIVGVRFQTSMVMQGAAEMLCYGTAVKIETSF
ncbi:MAG TPA: hypothetical protein DEB33_08295 [Gemmatimonadetes bacterium]|nr:hypothetical protein [Gemmatimonadota bacterium]|tara:strand:+ start:253 stop:576 length:324 start_codon:yes stop_codon:yes gene_type:complete